MRRPTDVIDLFCGGGGASLGLASAGLQHAAAVDLEPAAVLVAHRGGLPALVADVAALPVTVRPPVVWASTPCQCFSQAGTRDAANDERNGFPALFAALDELGPSWFVGEQVPGLLMHKADVCPDVQQCPRCYFDATVLPALQARFAHVEYRVLNAADHGTPQSRKRVILYGGPVPFRWPAATHSQEQLVRAKWVTGTYWAEHQMEPVGEPSRAEARILRDVEQSFLPGLEPEWWETQRWRTVRDVLGGVALRGERGAGLVERHGARRDHPPDEVAPTLGAGSAGSGPRQLVLDSTLPQSQRTESPDDPAHTVPATNREGLHVIGGGRNPTPDPDDERTLRDLTDDASTVIPANLPGLGGPFVVHHGLSEGREAPRSADDPAPTESGKGNEYVDSPKHPPCDPDQPGHGVRSGGKGHTAPPVYVKGAPSVTQDEPAGTIKAGGNVDASGHLGGGCPPYVRRRLTPAECARLQGWPEVIPHLEGLTKTAAYRIVGNAVPPPLAAAVGRALLATFLGVEREAECVE